MLYNDISLYSFSPASLYLVMKRFSPAQRLGFGYHPESRVNVYSADLPAWQVFPGFRSTTCVAFVPVSRRSGVFRYRRSRNFWVTGAWRPHCAI